jgi:hypothetical protein
MTTSGNSSNLVAKVVDGQTPWGNYNNDGSFRSQDDTTYMTPRARSSCHGTFEAIPMSGDARKYDQGQSAVWWFTPGAGTTHCDVAVYLPNMSTRPTRTPPPPSSSSPPDGAAAHSPRSSSTSRYRVRRGAGCFL